jgi:hypothetical protein
MITAKGILYTVVGAAIAGAVAGTLLTARRGNGIAAKLKKTAGDWLSDLRGQTRLLSSSKTSRARAEFDQANSPRI